MEISNPHDKFFKEVFRQKENAADLIRSTLPKNIVKLIDFESLIISNSSFVDNELKESFSDILLRVSINNTQCYIYILIEHKSYPDIWAKLQMLKYMCSIWQDETYSKDIKKYLTPIIPLLYYHGKNKWKSGDNFSDYFNVDDMLKEYIPHFKSIIYDLSIIDDDKITGNIAYIVSILAMKSIFTDLDEKLHTIMEILSKNPFEDEKINSFFRSLLYYIVEASNSVTNEKIIDTLTEIKNKKMKEAYMTVAEQLIEKGMIKGIEKGIEKGREEGMEKNQKMIVANMHNKGLSIDIIHEYTGIDKEKIVSILKETEH